MPSITILGPCYALPLVPWNHFSHSRLSLLRLSVKAMPDDWSRHWIFASMNLAGDSTMIFLKYFGSLSTLEELQNTRGKPSHVVRLGFPLFLWFVSISVNEMCFIAFCGNIFEFSWMPSLLSSLISSFCNFLLWYRQTKIHQSQVPKWVTTKEQLLPRSAHCLAVALHFTLRPLERQLDLVGVVTCLQTKDANQPRDFF